MSKSKIPYIDYVFNPITGCSGTGCQADCYAKRFVKARPVMHGYRYDKSKRTLVPIPFNEVRFHPYRLSEPLHWRKPRVVGVGFFGDLFDEQVDDYWIAKTFGIMALCQSHTFITLTKQPARMADFFLRFHDGDYERNFNWWMNEACDALPKKETFGIRLRPRPESLPLPNIWHGVTVCTQAEADERIPELLKVPGKKWLSLEPLLEPITINPFWLNCVCAFECDKRRADHGPTVCHPYPCPPRINAVVLGAESGPKRRPMPLEWAYDVVRQCKAVGAPCYVKQVDINGKVSKNPEEWPEGLRVRELPWRTK